MKVHARHFDQVAVRSVVRNVPFEKCDAMMACGECFEQAAQEGCVAVAPRRADRQTEENQFHFSPQKGTKTNLATKRHIEHKINHTRAESNRSRCLWLRASRCCHPPPPHSPSTARSQNVRSCRSGSLQSTLPRLG